MFSHRSCAALSTEQRTSAAGIHLVQPANKPDGQFVPEETFRKTVLLVEDENFVREVTREVLRSAGFSVVAVRSAVEAARVFEDIGGGVDLLLSDVVLPRETGPELAARLKAKDPQMKVLFMTGYAEQMKLLDTQREPFLAKPFSSEKLLVTVRHVLTGGIDLADDSGVASTERGLHDLGRNA